MQYILLAVAVVWVVRAAPLYQCVDSAFGGSCKARLYACTNSPECSYQLHENTRHIFLEQDSTLFPQLYFSHPLARDLYECLRAQCGLPPIDDRYPATLPFDYCLLELYDICAGDLELIFKNPKTVSAEADCYRKYCNFPQVAAE